MKSQILSVFFNKKSGLLFKVASKDKKRGEHVQIVFLAQNIIAPKLTVNNIHSRYSGYKARLWAHFFCNSSIGYFRLLAGHSSGQICLLGQQNTIPDRKTSRSSTSSFFRTKIFFDKMSIKFFALFRVLPGVNTKKYWKIYMEHSHIFQHFWRQPLAYHFQPYNLRSRKTGKL